MASGIINVDFGEGAVVHFKREVLIFEIAAGFGRGRTTGAWTCGGGRARGAGGALAGDRIGRGDLAVGTGDPAHCEYARGGGAGYCLTSVVEFDGGLSPAVQPSPSRPLPSHLAPPC